MIGAVKIDNWEQPSTSLTVMRTVLSAASPQILFIPAGFANGFMSLTPDTRLMFFSTCSLEASRGDDIRYAARHWDIWTIEER